LSKTITILSENFRIFREFYLRKYFKNDSGGLVQALAALLCMVLRIYVRFCAFLRIFVRFCAFLRVFAIFARLCGVLSGFAWSCLQRLKLMYGS
jgi:hypothetical protein